MELGVSVQIILGCHRLAAAYSSNAMEQGHDFVIRNTVAWMVQLYLVVSDRHYLMYYVTLRVKST